MKILSFSIKNYYSFNQTQKLEFNFDEHHVNAIFGPNGSGKTNFFRAIEFFCDFLQRSTDYDNPMYDMERFALRRGNENAPSEFGIEFATGKKIFRYVFSILGHVVIDESLEQKRRGASFSYETVFRRNSMRNNVYVKYDFTKELLNSTRDDSLVLTRAYQINNRIAKECFTLFDRLKLVAGRRSSDDTADKIANDSEFKEKVLGLLRNADLFIQDVSASQTGITISNVNFSNNPHKYIEKPTYTTMTTHFVRDNVGKIVDIYQFNLDRNESIGTKRIFELAYPILDTLENGGVLYLDEFEMALHPKECLFLVDLFQEKNNPKHAQLILNTHCTQIMDTIGYKNIILFGKNNYEETIIGKVTGDSRNIALEKKYIKGMFGAIPRIENSL